VPINTNIVVHVKDNLCGVDSSSIKMKVNNQAVNLVLEGTPADFTVTYDPEVDFNSGEVVQISIDASDKAGNQMETDSYTFTTYTKNQPPEITSAIILPRNTNNEIKISAQITDDNAVENAALFYRKGGDPVFISNSMSANIDSFQATIPASFVTSCGVEYYITATDEEDLAARAPSDGIFSIQVEVPEPGVVKETPQPNGSAQTAYRLITMPLDLNKKNPAVVLLDNLGTYNKKKWRFLDYHTEQEEFLEFPNTSIMNPGKAFWLIVKEAGKVIDTGAGKSNKTDAPFQIPLAQGWNLIGNPFYFTIPISNCKFKSNGQPPSLIQYIGYWTNPAVNEITEIVPFEGYAIYLNSDDTLFIDPDLSVNETSLAREMNSGHTNKFQWLVHISAQCQAARDVDNYAGVTSEASQNWDQNDYPEPPVIGEFVSVYFPHRDWETKSKTWCTDIRPESAGEMWEFEVITNIRDKVELTFDGLEQIPISHEIWLVDEQLQITQNLRESKHYFVAGSNPEYPKRLKLMVGSEDFIEDNLEEVRVIPMAYKLFQNFPNPFNPVTTIRYSLPQAGQVSLRVYNLLGEEVVTLIDSEQISAGFHVAIWDGKNKARQLVTSGVYVYQLQVGGFSKIRKMALLK